MSAHLSEQELYRLFREQLPSLPVPGDFKAVLQSRLLSEVTQTFIPSGRLQTVDISNTVGIWVSRLVHFVRHFQLTLPLTFLSFGVVSVLMIASTIAKVDEATELFRPPQVMVIPWAPAESGPASVWQPTSRSKPTASAGATASTIKNLSAKETEAAKSLPLSLFLDKSRSVIK